MRYKFFKAKAKYGGEWVVGDLANLYNKTFITTREHIQTEVVPETICISTGKWNDRNKMVFAGDIISFEKHGKKYTGYVTEKDYAFVVFAEAKDYFFYLKLSACEKVEILSNVHDNNYKFDSINKEYNKRGF